MFLYVKPEGKAPWKLIKNDEKALTDAIAGGARFRTVLSIDQDVDKMEDDAKVHYKGPLYFDIDNDQDENQSLYDVRRLLLSLYKDYGVSLEDLTIHVSGVKCFHVLVPKKVFTQSNAYQYLPYTYKKMALEFSLENLDYGIYSCGKGRQWRLENLQRENGRYKVRLSPAQVFALEWADILQISKHAGFPTPFLQTKDVEYSAELSALFKRSEFKPSKIQAVPDDKIKLLPKDPGCITKILEKKDLTEGRRFNQVVLVLASYAKARGWRKEELEQQASHLIEELPSSVYKTRRAKLSHLRSIYNYVASSNTYQFACINARKTVACEYDLCPACPIASMQAEVDYDPSLGIETAHNCYYRRTGEGRSQLSTFIIRPKSVIEFIDRNSTQFTIYANLISDNDRQAPVIFIQPDWASKSALIKKLPHPDFAYLGGDTDVQRLFKIVAQIQVPKRTGVKVIGMHKRPQDKSWHFVTAEGSLGSDGSEHELMLECDYNLPNLLISEKVANLEEVKQIAEHLFTFNDVGVTIPLVAWFTACFYKERIFEFTRQFPLLFIFGEAGAGKTQTILNLKRLFCLESDNIKSSADVTAFTLLKATNANNTIPLMLDEYKSSSLHPGQVKLISKLIRSSYNNEVGERGTSSQDIITYHYRSPIILAGEQTVTEPAARDRIIEVMVSRSRSAPHLASFRKLKELPLNRLGKIILLDALMMPSDTLRELFEESYAAVNEDFTDRPRFNQAILQLGIKLITRILEKYGCKSYVDKAWTEYLGVQHSHLREDIEESRKTDVDRILEAMSLMSDTDSRYKLDLNYDFSIKDDKLFIYMRMVHQKFLKFCSEYKADAEPMNYTSFLKLIRREPYFERDNVTVKMQSGYKPCMELSISNLKLRGLQLLSFFTLDEDNPNNETMKV